MNLPEIAYYLERAGLGDVGKTLFVNHMPSDCKQGIMLKGDYYGTAIDYELPDYRKTRFQLVVRAVSQKEGKQIAEEAAKLLTIENATLGEMELRYVRPRHEPICYPVSEGASFEFSVNFDAVYVIVEK